VLWEQLKRTRPNLLKDMALRLGGREILWGDLDLAEMPRFGGTTYVDMRYALPARAPPGPGGVAAAEANAEAEAGAEAAADRRSGYPLLHEVIDADFAAASGESAAAQPGEPSIAQIDIIAQRLRSAWVATQPRAEGGGAVTRGHIGSAERHAAAGHAAAEAIAEADAGAEAAADRRSGEANQDADIAAARGSTSPSPVSGLSTRATRRLILGPVLSTRATNEVLLGNVAAILVSEVRNIIPALTETQARQALLDNGENVSRAVQRHFEAPEEEAMQRAGAAVEVRCPPLPAPGFSLCTLRRRRGCPLVAAGHAPPLPPVRRARPSRALAGSRRRGSNERGG
jgi:hypothetical protein